METTTFKFHRDDLAHAAGCSENHLSKLLAGLQRTGKIVDFKFGDDDQVVIIIQKSVECEFEFAALALND